MFVPQGALVLLLLLGASAANAQATLGTGTATEEVERLKPGEFLWAPEIAPAGPVLLIVSTATQRAILYRNGVPIAVSTVSTGRKGYRTPTGAFTVLQKRVRHFSSIYDNAPMPYMQRLTWRGVALHGGQLPGYAASHGCIRLPHEFARLLFGATHLGMTVIVTDDAALPRLAPSSDPLPLAGGPADSAEPIWHPERAPTGPVSIIVSAADRRVVVLRDGRQIGSAPLAVNGPVEGTTAYMLHTTDAGERQWLSVALPGRTLSETPVTGALSRFSVNDAFRRSVAGIVAPGTTVIVTADSLLSGRASRPAKIVEAAPRERD